MEIEFVVSSLISLAVGACGALFGARQANRVWQRDQDQALSIALGNYERALTDMAVHLESLEPSIGGNHPKPKDLEETRQAAYHYMTELPQKERGMVAFPYDTEGRYAMEDAMHYGARATIIENLMKAKPGISPTGIRGFWLRAVAKIVQP